MKWSVRRFVNISMFLFACIIVVLQCIYIEKISKQIDVQAQQEVNGIVNRAEAILSDKITAAKKNCDKITNNMDVQLYLTGHGKDNGIKNNVTNFISTVKNVSDDTTGVLFFDSFGSTEVILNSLREPTIEILRNLYAEFEQNRLTGDMSFFTVNEDGYTYLCICVFEKIKKYDTSAVGVDSSAGVAMVYKVNLPKMSMDMHNVENSVIKLVDENKGTNIDFHSSTEEQIDIDYRFEKRVADTSWVVYGEYSPLIASPYFELRNTVWVYMGIFVLLLIVINVLMNMLIVKPVKEIAEFVNSYMFCSKKRLHTRGSKEFQEISKNFNKMLDHTEELSRKVVHTQQMLYEKEVNEKTAALYALQSQINPHFIYNTLDCIGSIAVVNNVVEIEDIVDSLAIILRYSTEYSPYTTVTEELEIVKKYFTIQNIRYQNKFELEIRIDADMWNRTILRMMIQPLVENAFKHGFFTNSPHNILKIHGFLQDDVIVFEVIDDGLGISPESYEKLLSNLNDDTVLPTKQIGIANINSRIKLHYGSEYGVEIESEYGKYTCVRVRIPSKHNLDGE